MIGKLYGRVEHLGASELLLVVGDAQGGVGYRVMASTRTLGQLALGQPASLLIETIVREDAFLLYGFASAAEHGWFRLLTTVQGVGAKVALALLGALTPEQLQLAIMAHDKAALTQAEGVGPKLAARLLVELKEKVSAGVGLGGGLGAGALSHAASANSTLSSAPVAANAAAAQARELQDTIAALEKLGYAKGEAWQAAQAAQAELGSTAATAQLLRAALQQLAQAA